MRILLDTHAFLWWLDGDEQLPPTCRGLIADEGNEVLISAASAWEISTKVRIGKLPGAEEVAAELPEIVAMQGFDPLPISVAHAQRAGALPGPHRDPFDRMLAAQAQAESVAIVSNDPAFDGFGVPRIWDQAERSDERGIPRSTPKKRRR
ncbi:MAG: twitching motility protein PilT [Deltaproteobacteria bacterium RIFOXYA12_FULL_58_15]|nr:MAG: twitching motility protein PilT [Deltaproteobacteria bacterium RIFOXYA12_FULL_58_15]OGR13908.1 MAG: twitching motility protein PilT [Deltaproteobacteria bacterium RIFOXYB12_FULL_58_9]